MRSNLKDIKSYFNLHLEFQLFADKLFFFKESILFLSKFHNILFIYFILGLIMDKFKTWKNIIVSNNVCRYHILKINYLDNLAIQKILLIKNAKQNGISLKLVPISKFSDFIMPLKRKKTNRKNLEQSKNKRMILQVAFTSLHPCQYKPWK